MRALRIVVLGGGTAGWLTACTLAARYPRRGADGVSVTLVESPDRPTIGVGEGTWPSIRETLRTIGIGEAAFLTATDASFKQGSAFHGWVDGTAGDRYLHPFTLPALAGDDLTRWLAMRGEAGFAAALCPQTEPCLAGCAPKAITHADYAGALNYAYHLDAGKFGALLAGHGTGRLGIAHVSAEVAQVAAADNGDIAALVTTAGARIAGDLFIDCSGLAARLIGGHYGVALEPIGQWLFNDRAIAAQMPYAAPDAPIAGATVATAQAAGWIWDIGLTSRRGVGHVYSSAHMADDVAEQALRDYVRAAGGDGDALGCRRIGFDPGYRRQFWVGNCVAIGLAAGFVEPLEASAIALIEQGARLIGDGLPEGAAGWAGAARRFNTAMALRWGRIVDFIKLHYVLGRRRDSPYWADNRAAASIPESLAELLAAWRHRPPHAGDFPQRDDLFPAASYQYILLGMGAWPDVPGWAGSPEAPAGQLSQVAEAAAAARRGLPANRALLDQIARFGLRRI